MSNDNKQPGAGYLTPVIPASAQSKGPKDPNAEPGRARKAFNSVARNGFNILKFGVLALVFGPILLGLQQCAVNTDYPMYSPDAIDYAGGITLDAYEAEANAARSTIKFISSPTKGWFGPVIEGSFDGPEATYSSTPHVNVCVPSELVRSVHDLDPEAMEYHASAMMQVERRLGFLNSTNDNARQLNPNKDFVIVVHKRTDDFNAVAAKQGSQNLITTVAVDYGQNRVCPPNSIKHKYNNQWRPEFESTAYDSYWRHVPGLRPSNIPAIK